MKVLLGTILSLSVLLLSAPDAAAHGGSFAHYSGPPPGLRDPTDPPPPPTRNCNYCAKPDCKQCSADDLVAGKRLAYARQNLYVRGSVGDVLRVDVKVQFKAKNTVIVLSIDQFPYSTSKTFSEVGIM